jgi:Holliday junction resolvase RusA-like endonuclease
MTMGEQEREKHRDAEMYDISPIDDTGFIAERERPIGELEDVIEFFVAGDPRPQGSTKSYYIKKLERVVTTHGTKETKKWQLRIAMMAQQENEKRSQSFYSGDNSLGYDLHLVFFMPRPKSLPKKKRLNTKRPDLDKLIRTVLDGLTNYIIPDDSQVVSVSARKLYAIENQPPGVRIRVVRFH